MYRCPPAMPVGTMHFGVLACGQTDQSILSGTGSHFGG
jgi:hypothetical protein